MARLLLIAALCTWPAMIDAAGTGQAALSALAAAVFAVATVGVGATANRPRAAGSPAKISGNDAAGPAGIGPAPADALRVQARANASLFAIVFLWGAGAIGLGYGLTALYWQHWWQYAAGMGLICGAIALYRWRLAQASSLWASPTALRAVSLATTATGLAALAGLVFLVGSGKLWAGKPDWLANHVFLAGGIAVAALSYLARRANAAPPLPPVSGS